jgi:predicted membrane protein
MKRPAVGIILVLLGCAFLFRNLGWIPDITRHIFSWPNILLLIGVGFLLSGKPKPALVLILIGAFFWSQRFWHFDMSLFWPAILIVLGIAFLLKNRENSSLSSSTADNKIDDAVIFSGSKKTYSSQAFEGGKISAMFGGTEMDLRETKPVDGAVIDLFIMFGGAEIKIPANWNVIVEASPIFGGISDERDKVTKDGPSIKIKGTVLFGGVEIKN